MGSLSGPQTSSIVQGSTNSTSTAENEPLYTVAERQWLKENAGGEYRFLRLYGLRITEEKDRSDGRRIARALMAADRAEEE